MKITYIKKEQYRDTGDFMSGQDGAYDAENLTIEVSHEELKSLIGRSSASAVDKLTNSISSLVDKCAKK